jgi:hypothetical protein
LLAFLKIRVDNEIMNKKISKIAITCFSCLLQITGFAVADKPEGG